jgi:hypothetical protein
MIFFPSLPIFLPLCIWDSHIFTPFHIIPNSFFSLGKESDPRIVLALFLLPLFCLNVFLFCDQEYWVMIFV